MVATTKDLKVLDEIDTEGLEMRINARAVLVLPWFVLIALTLRGGAFRAFYASSAGLLVVLVGGALSARRLLLDQPSRALAAGAPGARWRERRGGDPMTSTPLLVLAVGGAGIAAAGAAALVVPAAPAPRASRPAVHRRCPCPHAQRRRHHRAGAVVGAGAGGTFRRLFAPPLLAFAARVGHLVERRDDDELSAVACGRPGSSACRRTTTAPAWSPGSCCSVAAGAVFGIVVLHSTPAMLGLALCRRGHRHVARTGAYRPRDPRPHASGSASSSTP